MSLHKTDPTLLDGPSDQTRVIAVLRASARPRSCVEIAGRDPLLAHNRLQLLVALDELVASGQVAKRFDPTAQVWRYFIPPSRNGSGARGPGTATR